MLRRFPSRSDKLVETFFRSSSNNLSLAQRKLNRKFLRSLGSFRLKHFGLIPALSSAIQLYLLVIAKALICIDIQMFQKSLCSLLSALSKAFWWIFLTLLYKMLSLKLVQTQWLLHSAASYPARCSAFSQSHWNWQVISTIRTRSDRYQSFAIQCRMEMDDWSPENRSPDPTCSARPGPRPPRPS